MGNYLLFKILSYILSICAKTPIWVGMGFVQQKVAISGVTSLWQTSSLSALWQGTAGATHTSDTPGQVSGNLSSPIFHSPGIPRQDPAARAPAWLSPLTKTHTPKIPGMHLSNGESWTGSPRALGAQSFTGIGGVCRTKSLKS